MLMVKNTIYDHLNFGQFHSGYAGNVLQGRHGVLFEKQYVLSKYTPYSEAVIDLLAKETVKSLHQFQQELAKLGIDFILVLAPSKADCRTESLPSLWQFRASHTKTPPSAYPIWEKYLTAQQIKWVNGYDTIREANAMLDSFPDPGTHWSMLGTGVALERLSSVLYLSDSSRFFPVKIKNVVNVSTDQHEERDISLLLNIYPAYFKGKNSWPNIVYEPFPSSKSVSVISLGDSFSVQMSSAIEHSGFSHKLWGNNNWIPSKQEWINAIKTADVVILTYTYPKLFSDRIKKEVDTLLSYTQEIKLDRKITKGTVYSFTTEEDSGLFMLDSGWSYPEPWGTWSNDKLVRMVFDVEGNIPAHLEMDLCAFLFANHREQRMRCKLNGISLQEIVLRKNQERVSLDIGSAIQPGNNQLIIELPDAISPKELNFNGDVRQLAIGLRNLRFE